MAGTYPDSQIPRARSARQQFWLDHLRAWQAQGTSLRAYAAANGAVVEFAVPGPSQAQASGVAERARGNRPGVRAGARRGAGAGVSSASAQRRRRRGPRAHRARDVRRGARMREPAAMIRPAHHGIEVWLCVEPVDFRKQITGLATLVQDQLSKDPFSSQLFVFTNRRRKPVPDPVLGAVRLRAVAQAPGAGALRVAAPRRRRGEPERRAAQLPARWIRPVADGSAPASSLRLDVLSRHQRL